MYRLDDIYHDSELVRITIAHLELQLAIPLMGHSDLKLTRTNIDLGDDNHITPIDETGRARCTLLSKDWFYRYEKKEALSGSIFLKACVERIPNDETINCISDLSKAITGFYDNLESRQCDRQPGYSGWDEDVYMCAPYYIYPRRLSEFTQHNYSGHAFLCGWCGWRYNDHLSWCLQVAIDDRHYLEFSFTPSGFPIEDFGSKAQKEAFIQAQAHEFMSKIQITQLADHPVSA